MKQGHPMGWVAERQDEMEVEESDVIQEYRKVGPCLKSWKNEHEPLKGNLEEDKEHTRGGDRRKERSGEERKRR